MHIISLGGGGGITFLWEILRAVDMSFDFIIKYWKDCDFEMLNSSINN